ncbi:hypothetical protein L1049_013032 [Liquidambar formosana]|uniref:Uncharacterized protein n=1 Tax=Liquidambar formosana TaxID=63359 RepID=A0AAP0WXB3_LIQFO
MESSMSQGGTNDDVNQKCWAEVFDLCLDKWELLPPLPLEDSADPFTFMSAVVDALKTILIAFPTSAVIYMYDVTKKTWEESNHDLMKYVGYFHRSQPLVVGQTCIGVEMMENYMPTI